MGDFRRPRPNMGDQKSPKLPLDINNYLLITSHAVMSVAPHSPAISDNRPVPVPISRTLGSTPFNNQ